MRFTWVLVACTSVLGCGSSDDESGKSGTGGAGGAGGSGPWRTDAPLPEAIAHLSGAELGGKIWVAGGVAGGAVSQKVYAYDPAANTWAAGPELPLARERVALGRVGEALYAVGGYSDPDASPTDSTFVLEPGASAWKKVASLLLNRAGGYAAEHEAGKLIVVAGRGDTKLLGDSVVLDPATNGWSVKAAIPNPRVGFAGFVLSGWVHAVGGQSESGGVTNKVDVYEPKSDNWTSVADFPHPRDGLGAAVLDGKAYVVGGDAAGTVDVWDGSAWSSGPPLATPRIGAAVVSAAGRVYVIGGEAAAGGASNAVESYAP
ncbi:MAG: hypothetical protein HYZ29_22605 [Myxococcales bacterium]|nr:hypothetical protein [Myxococcales bacterium]